MSRLVNLRARWGVVPREAVAIDRLSIELTRACSKGCWFCYNHSSPDGTTRWTPDEVVDLVVDCVRHGVKAVSFGGGEPLQYPGVFEVLERLSGVAFRSLTTNGLLLDDCFDRLVSAAPNKVHVSIHFPGHAVEVERALHAVRRLREAGIRAGVNLLVRRSGLADARTCAQALRDAGIANDSIVYLPMRGQETPTAQELAVVAGSTAFQSMSCLIGCAASPRFVSIDWDRRVAWCSYTDSRRPLPTLDYAGLRAALDGLQLRTCEGAPAPVS